VSPAPKNAIPRGLLAKLDEAGATVTGHREIDYATQYHLERGHDSARLNVYTTGKIVPQGKSSGLKDLLDEGVATSGGQRVRGGAGRPGSRPALDGVPRVGIDEAGKGDYFGPLVVAGVRITGKKAAEDLQKAGVRDSKDLGDAAARTMAQRILEAVGTGNVRVVTLSPREYEAKRTRAGNVNKLLDEIDAEIIGELKDEVELIVVDQYAVSARENLKPFVPEGVRLEVRQRAEDDAAVAAASVLARARYLEELESLSARVGFRLPKGATHVIGAGRRVFEERGLAGLEEVAKVSFRTTERITGGTS
jgi:ribonuclease HIII